jgi:hypothetical protein
LAAWEGNCQFLVTHDEQLIQEGNRILKEEEENLLGKLRICDTKEIIRILEEIVK